MGMLQIRREQMDALRVAADQEFVKRAAAHLRKQYPALTNELTNAVLEEMVKKGVARARAHGFKWESSLIRFLELMLAIAPNFDEVPAIRKRLLDSSGSEVERIALLLDTTTFSEWQEAARNYDPGAWGLNVNQHPVLLELHGEFPQ
jgi:hypothetical protein